MRHLPSGMPMMILLAFFKAGICGLDAATDLALAEIMYRVANKYKKLHLLQLWQKLLQPRKKKA